MQADRTYAGIDVSAKTLTSRRWREGEEQEREFSNDGDGHRQVIRWLGKGARVCLEATGVYHLQLCLALCAAGIEVMVLNPKAAKAYAGSYLNRSKNDRVDAWTLLDYVRRRDFMPWQAPSKAVLELRELGRRLSDLVQQGAQEKNRLHAKTAADLSRAVVADIRDHVRQIERRVKNMEGAAYSLIHSDSDLGEQYRMLVRGNGIGRRSAVLLMTELAVLDPTMTVKQLVAYAGLDPREFESGSSVHKQVRISKVGNARIRAILYMVALGVARRSAGARAFRLALLARGKKKMQAVVAIMRKLLHGIWTVLQRRVAFDPEILFAASLAKAGSPDPAVAANQPEPARDHPKGRSEAEELRQQLDPGTAQATSRKKRNAA